MANNKHIKETRITIMSMIWNCENERDFSMPSLLLQRQVQVACNHTRNKILVQQGKIMPECTEENPEKSRYHIKILYVDAP